MPVPYYEDVDMEQGADFNWTVNWYGGGVFRAPIEEIDSGYPTKIRVSSHLLPTVSDTPVIISGVQGMEILNSKDLGIEEAAYVDADYFSMPISTVACNWVIGTGEITWHRPTDFTNLKARCQIRSKWHSGTVITELTTENGGILLDANDASIALFIGGAVTATFLFGRAYFDIELYEDPGTVIHRPVGGSILLSREITRA